MDIPLPMKDREISIKNEKIILRDEVETLYEKTVTPFGNSGKVDVPRKFIGKRVYVIVLKD
jgi:putative transposon-encoded protein